MKIPRIDIENAITKMDQLLRVGKAKINEAVFDDYLMQSINNFIEYFVQLSAIELNDVEKTNESLADCLVEIVESINCDDEKNLFKLYNSDLQEKYYKFKEVIMNYASTLKYKIIVCGINKYSELMPSLIDNDRVDIIAYIDSGNQNVGKYFNNKIIISINQINNYGYDYLFVTDDNYKKINKIYGIPDDYLIDYKEFLNKTLTSPEYFVNYYNFIESEKNYDGIITGISYAQKGIDASSFSKKFFNLAAPCQDLYYDYETMKFALSFKELRSSIKYAIIGLCYYSFQYDLSQSIFKDRVWYYYPTTNTIHNYKNDINISFFNDFYNKIRKILNSNHVEVVWQNLMDGYYKTIIENSSKKVFNSEILSKEDLSKISSDVKRTFNKDYPKTVEENKEIFTEFLELLKENEIKPIIVICPQTKIYCENISTRIKDEFENIISEFTKRYEFQYIDYSYSTEFSDSDFIDSSHLNRNGAIKFTKILEKKIQW